MSLAAQSKAQTIPKKEGKNYTLAHTGKFSDLRQYELQHPKIDRKVHGKLFLKDHLHTTSTQVSLNQLPKGVSVPFLHAHKVNEELYIFTGGKGQMQVDGDIFDVEEGTVVRVAPGGLRSWRNTGDTDLFYIVIQAKDGSLSQDTFDDGIPSEEAVIWD
jgi:mannose-6-phosphate isomerase-like protein (cupin superfamily)